MRLSSRDLGAEGNSFANLKQSVPEFCMDLSLMPTSPATTLTAEANVISAPRDTDRVTTDTSSASVSLTWPLIVEVAFLGSNYGIPTR